MVPMIEKPLFPHMPLVDAIRSIEESRRRIAVVVDEKFHLIGTLTDGDVRRCLLDGGTLETPVSKAMNKSPRSARDGCSDGHLLKLMKNGNVLSVPIVDGEGCFKRLVHLMELAPEEDNGDASGLSFAVIMAGGEGTRLRTITENIPKPMVDICGSPLLERQIHTLAKTGISKVYISVNYLSHVIEDHFGNGERFGLEINYLRENKKLGTGGALSLLPERPDRPIVVMNGDILTTSDFGCLHSFHESHGAKVTVAAVEYHIHIPFGVIRAEGPYVQALAEKPSQRFLCNAGMYIVSPEALDLIPSDMFFNMTDLIEKCLESNFPVSVFPVHEYWSDIGTPADLEKARRMFSDEDGQLAKIES
jgi:dTDP-glucose pyrophosphorylase